MIVYLSLKQILLNQIAVLIRKQSDKSNDDPERLLRRLHYLQQALEQIKSYQHNSNFQYVIKHFNMNLTESEQQEIRKLSARYDDNISGGMGDNGTKSSKQNEKSGFTTQRSETLFTGAAEEQYDPSIYTNSDHELDDEKTPIHSSSNTTTNNWIHYKGFSHWLKKQSFIKFKKRNDQEKYKKIWNTILGLNLINLWEKGKIKPMNIIGRYGTSQPYIAIHKCGSKEVVKASLLRLSVTQNRIFRFNISLSDLMDGSDGFESNSKSTLRSGARRSIDMDNETDNIYNNSEYKLSANELIQGKNLFDAVGNKDVLRIVATMLWDTNLANNVLEELLHNPRFSMYGIHAKNIADTIAKEMHLQTSVSPQPQSPLPVQQQKQPNDNSVAQFDLPPSPQKTTLKKQSSPQKQQIYDPKFNNNMPKNNNNNNSYANNNNNANNASTFSFTKNNKNNNNNNNTTTKITVNGIQKSVSPSPQATETVSGHGHKHSGSVVFHDNLRDSQINDGIDYADGDDEDSISNSAEMPQHAVSNDNIGFGRQTATSFDDNSSPSGDSRHSNESFLMTPDNQFETNDNTQSAIIEPRQSIKGIYYTAEQVTMFDSNVSAEFTGFTENENQTNENSRDSVDFNTDQVEKKETNIINTDIKVGIRAKKSVRQRTSFLKRDFVTLKQSEQWNKVTKHLNVIFNNKVALTLKNYAIEEEFDFQAILDDVEDYPEEPDDSNIMEYMQQSFNWNKRECDKFFRTLKRILMDRKKSRRTSSLIQILGFNISDVNRDPNSTTNLNDYDNNNSDKMYINQFNQKWSNGLVESLQKYCVEEEYDLEAIAEDLETFEEENSMIVEEIAKQYNWDDDTSKIFVEDLRKLISTDPQQAKKHLSIVNSDDDDDESD